MDYLTKMQAASSLNSSHCYILEDNGLFLTWLGSLSLPNDHNILDLMMNKLCVRRIRHANPSFLLSESVMNIESYVAYIFYSELL